MEQRSANSEARCLFGAICGKANPGCAKAHTSSGRRTSRQSAIWSRVPKWSGTSATRVGHKRESRRYRARGSGLWAETPWDGDALFTQPRQLRPVRWLESRRTGRAEKIVAVNKRVGIPTAPMAELCFRVSQRTWFYLLSRF